MLSSTPRRGGSALALSVGAVLSLAPVAALAASPLPPRLPTSFETPARGLAVEPKLITISQDGNAFIAGPRAHGYTGGDSGPKEPAIHWTQWSSREAAATGAVVQGNCTPSCAQGTFTAYAISVKLSRPMMSHGQLIFTRMSMRFRGRRPSNYRRTTVFTAKYIPAADGSPAAWGLVPN